MTRKKKKLFIGLAIGLFVVVIIVLNLVRSSEKAVKVQAEEVQRGKITSTVSAACKVQPEMEVDISANVSGRIVQLGVKEGDRVEKGQFLVQLDRNRYQALVDQAQIDYPEELVQRTLDRMLFEQDMALQRQGLNLDLFLRMEGKTREQLQEEQREEAEARLQRSLALGKVAELEELEVTPLEAISYIRMLSSTYGDQAEEVRHTMLASEPFQESVRQDLLAEKATGRLVSIAKGEVEVAEAATDITEPAAEAETPESVEAAKIEEEPSEGLPMLEE